MKSQFRNVLAVFTVSVVIGASGAPPVANSGTATTGTPAVAFVPLPIGGAMNPGPVGGQMLPGAVGGMLSPGGILGPLTPASAYVNGIPSGSLYFGSNWIPQVRTAFAPAGGTLNGSGTGGVRSGVVVTGGASNPPGGTLSGGGVGGIKSAVIVTGGIPTAGPGGTLSAGGTGGLLNSVKPAGSPSSVIVTGGSKP